VTFNTGNLYPSFLKGPRKIKDECRKIIYFELFGDNCMEIITTGQILLSNYELSRFFKQPGKFVCILPPWDTSSK
jgi:hypothetical protein